MDKGKKKSFSETSSLQHIIQRSENFLQALNSNARSKCPHLRKIIQSKMQWWDFLGGPVAKTALPMQGIGLIPGWGTRSHTTQLKILQQRSSAAAKQANKNRYQEKKIKNQNVQWWHIISWQTHQFHFFFAQHLDVFNYSKIPITIFMLQVVSSSISFGSCACMNSPRNQEKSLKVNYWTKGKR